MHSSWFSRAHRDGQATQGFALIELLVVITIIAVLASMLVPTVNLVRESAKRSICRSNLRQLSMATFAYLNDNEGFLMDAGTNGNHGYYGDANPPVGDQMRTYLDNFPRDAGGRTAKIMRCPSAHKDPNGNWLQFSYHAGQAIDYPRTLNQIQNLAKRYTPDGQLSLWADSVVYGTNGPVNINYVNHNPHNRLLKPDGQSGIPAGGNAVYSDGSVRWLPYFESPSAVPAGTAAFMGGFIGVYAWCNTAFFISTDGGANAGKMYVTTWPIKIGTSVLTAAQF